ncbi:MULTISPECIES: DUF1223 domain-containing protein [Pseudomonas]|mgnify:CR=1 FL=1|uniref:DUF1223 domain-containing protein n=1 Tax=Pseudomonas TaxID=286 RepID=UPI000C10625F|nr:hypothetical protein [Pseudomonadaceae bacterium]HCP53156.1 DUF1223 domain-containing protein [Pseudomonas sp.]
MKKALSSLLAVLAMGSAAYSAAAVHYSSGETSTALLEVYTSEGCSSCPPAEAWLSQLVDEPGLWRDFIPLAFHVDYWDQLGWADRFANPAYSARQRGYAQIGSARAVYTPGFMLAGQEWRGWFENKTLPVAKGQAVGVLDLKLDKDNVELSFKPQTTAPTDMIAYVARLGFDLDSKVVRGENAGKLLHHDFVVLSLQQVAAKQPLNWSTRLYPNEQGKRQAIVAWINQPGQLQPYQAVAGWIER